MIKKCADRARAASENNWQKKKREKTHLKTTPQRHTQSTKNTEVTNAESRMENSGREGQKGGGRGWGKLYNCCKRVWLGGQRNNQLKALMASDGVAVQGRWQVSDWGWSCDWGCGWGMWCASAANNGAMASVISCNCFPSFMTTTSSSVSVSASCSVSLCLSLSLLTFSFSWLLRFLGQTKRANFKLRLQL